MRILLVTPKFHGYYHEIANSLNRKGCDVTVLFDNYYPRGLKNAISVFSKRFTQSMYDRYFEKAISDMADKQFDKVVLIFGGFPFSRRHVAELKKKQPRAEFIYYNWDSVGNYSSVLSFLDLFDKRFSFDLKDCEKYGFDFLPLFYCNDFLDVTPTHDALALMSFSAKKAEGLKLILSKMPENLSINRQLVLENFFSYIKHRFFGEREFKGFGLRSFVFKPYSRTAAFRLIADAKVVLDCPLEGQDGLTVRTLETLHQKRKLITTNKEILKYPFYNSANIFLVTEESPLIPMSFFETPFDEKLTDVSNYSIDNFVTRLFGL